MSVDDQIARFVSLHDLTGDVEEELRRLLDHVSGSRQPFPAPRVFVSASETGSFGSLPSASDTYEAVPWSGTMILGADDAKVPQPDRAAATVIYGEGQVTNLEPAPNVAAGEGYQHVGLIGVGSMGEVHRVRDLALDRTVAMKVMKPGRVLRNPKSIQRFVEEARAVAALEHPGIVPVYQLGQLPDGRYFFTMKEIIGRTFSEVIAEYFALPPDKRWEGTASGWTFRRLIQVFYRVCEAVAFAHARSVIHRDLKPDNVVIGRFGEVYVVDWGLAKLVGEMMSEEEQAEAEEEDYSGQGTLAGSILGTPQYMSPEQAMGESHQHGRHSDVFSLGAMLYELLSGRPPYQGDSALEVIAHVQSGPPAPLDESLEVPPGLARVLDRCMQREVRDRYPSAEAVMVDVQDWLDQSKQREKAMAALKEARRKQAGISRLMDRAHALRAEASIHSARLTEGPDIEQLRAVWKVQDEAERLEQGARLLETVVTQLARSALQQVPDLPEGHAFLADVYVDAHRRAEAEQDAVAAAQYEMLVKAHDRARNYTRYLEGTGRLSLSTNPPVAQVRISRFVDRDRKLVPEHVRTVSAPIHALELPRGSYLLEIASPGRHTVQYPVHIERDGHWDCVPEPGAEPVPIYLPEHGSLGIDEVYVPGGWYRSGGDALAGNGLPARREWVDGFVMMRDPVTYRLYDEFLDALVRRGRENEVMRAVPRGRKSSGPYGRSLYQRESSGRFVLKYSEMLADNPVSLVDRDCCTMFAYWYSVRTGRHWRIPHESQWEKAARGVDGRPYPWGPRFDASLCAVGTGSHPVGTDRFPWDESPYGIRGMGGNVREWCDLHPYLRTEAYEGLGVHVRSALRGGAVVDGEHACRSAGRILAEPKLRSTVIGFRLVRELEEDPAHAERGGTAHYAPELSSSTASLSGTPRGPVAVRPAAPRTGTSIPPFDSQDDLPSLAPMLWADSVSLSEEEEDS